MAVITKKAHTENHLENINEMRRLNEMQVLEQKEKKCLKCNAKFLSEGSHNRMCPSCRCRNKEESRR
jgi:tRNA(Ile2) C34 agmatinyltransferase TiaS